MVGLAGGGEARIFMDCSVHGSLGDPAALLLVAPCKSAVGFNSLGTVSFLMTLRVARLCRMHAFGSNLFCPATHGSLSGRRSYV